MIKTEQQLARTELEWHALDSAISEVKYFHTSAKYSWKTYCQDMGSAIDRALQRAEFWRDNPDYKFG